MQGGSGSANNIKFQNIEMKNVANPIIIDQNYCDQLKPCKEQVKYCGNISNIYTFYLYITCLTVFNILQF